MEAIEIKMNQQVSRTRTIPIHNPMNLDNNPINRMIQTNPMITRIIHRNMMDLNPMMTLMNLNRT